MASCDHKAKTAEIQWLRNRVFAYADKGLDGTDFKTLSAAIQSVTESMNEAFVSGAIVDEIAHWAAIHDRNMIESGGYPASDLSSWAGIWMDVASVQKSLVALSGSSQDLVPTIRSQQAVAICTLQALSKVMADSPQLKRSADVSDTSDDGLFKLPLRRNKSPNLTSTLTAVAQVKSL